MPAGGAEQPPMGAWGELAPGSRPADGEGPSDRLLLQELPSVDGAPPLLVPKKTTPNAQSRLEAANPCSITSASQR